MQIDLVSLAEVVAALVPAALLGLALGGWLRRRAARAWAREHAAHYHPAVTRR